MLHEPLDEDEFRFSRHHQERQLPRSPRSPPPLLGKYIRDSAHVHARVSKTLRRCVCPSVVCTGGPSGTRGWRVSWQGPHIRRGIVGKLGLLALTRSRCAALPGGVLPPKTMALRDQKSSRKGGGRDAVIERLSKVQNVVLQGRIAWHRVRSLTQIPRRPPSPVGRGNQGPRRFRFKGSNRVADEAGKVTCLR